MSNVKSTSHTLLKSINQQKVLHLIFSEYPISRVELAQKTGLSTQTVTNIVNRLLQDKVIIEGEPQALESGSGRKRVPLLISASRYCAIGLELSGSSAKGALYNFRNERLASFELRENGYSSEEDLLRVVRGVLNNLVEKVPNTSELKGIGVSVHGLVDSSQGMLLRSPGLGWKRIPLGELLEEEFTVPVYLENDTNLLALNENMGGSLALSRNNVTFKFDRGIGGAIVVEKQLVTGSSFVAGEVGHIKTFSAPFDYPCYCGGKGCLTTLASAHGIGKNIGVTLESFAERLRSEEPEAVQLAGILMAAITNTIANTVTLLNPDRVLITGSVLKALGSVLISELEAQVLANVPETCRSLAFIHKEDSPDGTALAVGLVLQNVFKIPIDQLSL
ncbi:ROK family transcriptional regulator [Paenibacillus sp. GD4]|uniref:ROK family transcriptional regulator n=1 Tax=Paenibacillus sp. GD4 TaxID=3068890 RepID=UPI002796D398|nr:ROK family transcriptional regulator [Paenibacillus sp. GD4]MDQ1913708.1 ROK family transcriptional regulator [Paenibacillus sp. GD4]